PLPEICRSVRRAGCRDHRAYPPQTADWLADGPRRALAMHRDGRQRHQIRLPEHAAGRCLPQRSGDDAANADRRRHRFVTKAAHSEGNERKKIFPQKTWRSEISTMTINGHTAPLPEDRDALLVDVIRDRLGLTGTKLVCGSGVCGACTVLLDGAPVVSCLLPTQAAAAKSVTTIEGIGAKDLHPIQKAFMAHDALQCGFCTPGFVVEAAAFHDHWRAAKGNATPSRQEIGAALSGH